MSIKARIEGANGILAKTGARGALQVNEHIAPAKDLVQEEVQQQKIFVGLLQDVAGSSDLNIDGSATSVAFRTVNSVGQIVWVDQVRFIFHSSNMNITTAESRRFGPITAPGLTTGLSLTAYQNGDTTQVFASNVQKLGDFYRYVGMGGGAAVGINGSIISDIDSIANGTDYFMAVFHFPTSVALFPGTLDRIEVVVADDLTGIDLFNVIYTGHQQVIKD